MNIRHLFLTLLVIAGLVPVSFAAEPVSPLHNPINGLDVDGNDRVQPRDAALIISLLLHSARQDEIEPLATSTSNLYLDTTDDGRITPRDALLVIGHLLSVPEPSSFILGGFGICGLLAFAWRKRRAG